MCWNNMKYFNYFKDASVTIRLLQHFASHSCGLCLNESFILLWMTVLLIVTSIIAWIFILWFDKAKVMYSLARSLKVENLLPLFVGSIINYLQKCNATEVAQWVAPSCSRTQSATENVVRDVRSNWLAVTPHPLEGSTACYKSRARLVAGVCTEHTTGGRCVHWAHDWWQVCALSTWLTAGVCTEHTTGNKWRSRLR